ncbi:1-deoxy-D-xylulose-5-phosphate reductoisomerase [Sedimenticola selenatireducens]|uniref:1-deoxy-D-xylulose 5-phosphate reductoisomerase n=1 Tax=Sedimenticola selenatireducens TaxID=191960 RepID=A0A558DVA5_9GAMM|nr:1-deoxy-D-xylulose-5-phosphate reductoisomerase [Sedimenticola selenatireducens]TVO77661.1 1-deoxy-D-xylulose-5-phosphate reductoisomerase [Sedimenticola selenatireducens]TVT64967.1 MAG: 1-deoxy-D-xylulose-5-phosphate reductoisomerase [Sedimenticola selenatireducens]
MIGLTVLGSTGSIGISTLDVIGRHPDRYRVIALTANRDVDGLFNQCKSFLPHYAVMADANSASELEQKIRYEGLNIEVLSGVEGLEYVASLEDVAYVMAAIVGAAGLLPALAAARAGKRILLANKEALVVAGELFMREAAAGGAEILPIDSEHNAVFQCMPANFHKGLEKVGVTQILLTASGGPFRRLPLDQLQGVTPAQACAHPNWEMGRKISVDSATMMNKGLEVIEACWLFHTQSDRVKVVLHPQSVIHSMVAYSDGSVLAQLGNPDMRTPIAHALAWPERIVSGVEPLDLFEVARLDFEEPDFNRFSCLRLAYEAIEQGGTCPAILNAANEVAVASFLAGGIAFTAIPQVIESVLESLPGGQATGLGTLLSADAEARRYAEQMIQNWV